MLQNRTVGELAMSEQAFRRMLISSPKCWSNYLVYADWLEEQGDWRAAGYRWMGEQHKRPFRSPVTGACGWIVSTLEGGQMVLPMPFLRPMLGLCDRYDTRRDWDAGRRMWFNEHIFDFGSVSSACDALCIVVVDCPDVLCAGQEPVGS
jgi:uncharacterized protein (TIGR02996 family)